MLPMTLFERRTTGIRSDDSTNWATTTAQKLANFCCFKKYFIISTILVWGVASIPPFINRSKWRIVSFCWQKWLKGKMRRSSHQLVQHLMGPKTTRSAYKDNGSVFFVCEWMNEDYSLFAHAIVVYAKHIDNSEVIRGGSPGLVVMGYDSWSRGRGFESQHCLQDVHDIFKTVRLFWSVANVIKLALEEIWKI